MDLTLVLCMSDQKGGVEDNATPVIVGPMKTQSAQLSPDLFILKQYLEYENMQISKLDCISSTLCIQYIYIKLVVPGLV